jgi:hypothetical protein
MMIEKYISALLYRYQCVSVPGFGAFLTETVSAAIDIDSNTFYPPKKLISFNANLKNNDGLLANHIALHEKISYNEAVSNIELVVSSWHTALAGNEKLALKNIGELAYNNEGSLVFYPDTPVNYLMSSFGLGTFNSPTVRREELKAQVEKLEEKAPVIFTPERKQSYSYLKYAAFFATALFVGGVSFKMYHDREINAQTLLVEQSVQAKVQNKIQEATFFIENPLPAVKLTVKEDNALLYYHIVASAFKSKANADKEVLNLKAKGFNAKRLEKNDFGLYPVLYGSYANFEEAHKSMNEIHKKYNKEAWLLVKDLQF